MLQKVGRLIDGAKEHKAKVEAESRKEAKQLAVSVRAKFDATYSKQLDHNIATQDKWYQETSGYLKRIWETRDDVRIPVPKKQRRMLRFWLEFGCSPVQAREYAYKAKVDGVMEKITPEEVFGCYGKYKQPRHFSGRPYDK